MNKSGYIYIITNKNNTTLYTGVTSNINRRIYVHKSHIYDGFSKRYNLGKLVYYEEFNNIKDAINREKQIKAGSRKKKENLINSINPKWNDLSDEWYD